MSQKFIKKVVVVPNLWCCGNTVPQPLYLCLFQHYLCQDGSRGWPVDMVGRELPVRGDQQTRNGQESLPAHSEYLSLHSTIRQILSNFRHLCWKNFQHWWVQDCSKGWPGDVVSYEQPVKGDPQTWSGQESLFTPSKVPKNLKFPKNRHRSDPGGLLGRKIRMFLGLI